MQDARSPPGSVKLPGSWNRVKALDLQGVFGLGNPPYNQETKYLENHVTIEEPWLSWLPDCLRTP